MDLKLAAPLLTGVSALGGTLRLHDIDEVPRPGAKNDPMKFTLTFTPYGIPEPGTFVLFGAGLASLIGIAALRRGAVRQA